MKNEIEFEYNQFLKDIESPGFCFGSYMDEIEYESEYSHNEIDEAIEILQEKIKSYLHENKSGKFIVMSGWCIQVMTLDRARQSQITEQTIERILVR